MKFISQICTTREQSERLLSLGLKKETADMCWIEEWGWNDEKQEPFCTGNYFVRPIDYVWDDKYINYIPAWSLHRLIEMMPNKTGDYELNINARKVGYYSCVGWGYSFDLFEKEGEVFNCLIDCIEWLIKEGYFPKEYLV